MIDIGIHTSLDTNRATVDHGDSACWLAIKSGDGSLSIYAKMNQLPALQMMADIFNDAFGPKVKADDAAVAPVDWDSLEIPYGEPERPEIALF